MKSKNIIFILGMIISLSLLITGCELLDSLKGDDEKSLDEKCGEACEKHYCWLWGECRSVWWCILGSIFLLLLVIAGVLLVRRIIFS